MFSAILPSFRSGSLLLNMPRAAVRLSIPPSFLLAADPGPIQLAQAFAPFGVLATWKITTALTSKDERKQGSIQGVTIWLLIAGLLYGSLVYRSFYPVAGSMPLADLLGVPPPAYAADGAVDSIAPLEEVDNGKGLKKAAFFAVALLSLFHSLLPTPEQIFGRTGDD